MIRILRAALFGCLTLVILPPLSLATIAFDNTSNANTGLAVGVTVSHTVTSNTNGILIVGVGLDRPTGPTVSGITALKGGVATALTFIRADGTGVERTELWYILLPDTGTNSVVLTYSAQVSGSIVGVVSLTGVDQVSPIDAQNGTFGNSGTASTSVTTVADNAWIVDAMLQNSSATVTMTPHTNRVERWNVSQPVDLIVGAGSTQGPITPAGASTMDWTFTAIPWAISAASFKPFVSAAVTGTKIMGPSALVGKTSIQ